MFWPFMAVRQRAAAIASATFISTLIAMEACRMTTGLRTSSGIGHSSRIVGAIMRESWPLPRFNGDIE
jgi:hypothetical protein